MFNSNWIELTYLLISNESLIFPYFIIFYTLSELVTFLASIYSFEQAKFRINNSPKKRFLSKFMKHVWKAYDLKANGKFREQAAYRKRYKKFRAIKLAVVYGKV